MARNLKPTLSRSRVLPLEALCIEEGVHCWYVEAGIDVLQFDGNLLGACNTALIAALKNGLNVSILCIYHITY